MSPEANGREGAPRRRTTAGLKVFLETGKRSLAADRAGRHAGLGDGPLPRRPRGFGTASAEKRALSPRTNWETLASGKLEIIRLVVRGWSRIALPTMPTSSSSNWLAHDHRLKPCSAMKAQDATL